MQRRESETKNIVMGIITGIICGTVLILGLVVLFGWYFYILHERQETTYFVEEGDVARASSCEHDATRPTTHPHDSEKNQD